MPSLRRIIPVQNPLKSKRQYIFLLFSVLFTLTIVTLIVVDVVRKRSNKQQNNDYGVNVKVPATVEKVDKYDLKGKFEEFEAQSPWLEGNDITKSDYSPVLEELDGNYKFLRDSYRELNYKNYSIYASSQMKWFSDMNLELVGFDPDKQLNVYKKGRMADEKNFITYSEKYMTESVKNYPNNKFVALSINKTSAMGKPSNFYLIGEDDSTEKLITYNDYPEIYMVCYDIKDLDRANISVSENKPCSLMVYFVYENKNWKVLSENWQLK